jgi:hypothetical protein
MTKWDGNGHAGGAMISRLFGHARPVQGAHLRGKELTTREGKGREFNQIGRRLAEAKAVRMIERAIDQSLGTGQGRKLLKEVGKDTGGIYGRLGADRITEEQKNRALAELAVRVTRARMPEKNIDAPVRVEQGRIAADAAVPNETRETEQARLRKHALSGETIGFRLAADDDKALRQELVEDFDKAKPTEARQLDPQFQKDKHRLTSLKLMNEGEVVRDLCAESREAKSKDNTERDGIFTKALMDFARVSDDEDDETVANRAFYLSVLVNQRTIASAYTRTAKMLGGQPSSQDDIDVNLQKFKAQDGTVQFGVHIMTAKTNIKCFEVVEKQWNKKYEEWQDVMIDAIPTDRVSSSLFVDQDFQISAGDLAHGNGAGLIIEPVEITAKMSPM